MDDAPILVATDLSARADRALERALQLGNQFGRDVCGVHVPEFKEPSSLDRNALLKRAMSVVPPDHRAIEFIFPEGSAPKAIASAADSAAAHMLVIAVARHNSIRDYFLGTAVDYVLRNTSSPVLVVKLRGFAPYEDIVCPTDFSDDSKRAIERGAAMFPDAKLHFVHGLHIPWQSWNQAPYVEQQLADDASKEMESFISDLRITPEHAERLTSKVVTGSVHSAVNAEIEAHDANLVMLGSHGASGFRQATIGSITSELLDMLPVDCLVIKTRS